MTTLSEMFPLSDLDNALVNGTVQSRRHPNSNLYILNYTERCQYESGHWNPVTLACRGLIYDGNTGEVVARPFRKFFNFGQSESPSISLDEPVVVTDKMDGSLGIVYWDGWDWAVATRGSFESEQAQWATEFWRHECKGYRPPDGWTILVEIIYPENRIVVNYGERKELVLLGAVCIETGQSISPWDSLLAEWPHGRAESFRCANLSEALALPSRPNAEGIVIHAVRSDVRVKVKQEDYLRLHRIVTGLTERTIWEHLASGMSLSTLLEQLPDEFHGWVSKVADGLMAQVERNAVEVERAYSTILATLPADATRKDFALIAKEHSLSGCLFARYSEREYRDMLWKLAYPAASNSTRYERDV